MGVNFKRDDVGDHGASQLANYPAVNLTSLQDFYNNQVNFKGPATPNGDNSSVNYNFAEHLAVPEAYYSFGLYFQDEFRVNSNLKLTLALRADRNSGQRVSGYSTRRWPCLQPVVYYRQQDDFSEHGEGRL